MIGHLINRQGAGALVPLSSGPLPKLRYVRRKSLSKVGNMESSITAGPIMPQGTDVLAQTSYTLREEDFVAWWMYCWEHAQNQRLHPLAHRLVDWTGLTIKRCLAIVLLAVIASVLAGEKSTNYLIGAALFLFCWVLGIGLVTWFLRGPKGPFRKLARIR